MPVFGSKLPGFPIASRGNVFVTASPSTRRKRNGAVDQARGLARVSDRTSQAQLKVSLVSFLGWRPFWGDYWILGLDPDYDWAIVGEPNRRYGWILARGQSLDSASLATINAILERNGYDIMEFQPPLNNLTR
jgi:apolipoprotein D and lipocalin family protein